MSDNVIDFAERAAQRTADTDARLNPVNADNPPVNEWDSHRLAREFQRMTARRYTAARNLRDEGPDSHWAAIDLQRSAAELSRSARHYAAIPPM